MGVENSILQWTTTIPKEWDIIRINDVKDRKSYYPIGDGDHGSISPENYQDEGVPYIRVQNLTWGKDINFNDIVYISERINNKNRKSILKSGDILIAKTGATIGKTGIIPADIIKANTTSSVGKITVDNTIACNTYVYYCLASDICQKQMWERASMKSAQPGFNIEELIKFKIPLPNIKEQKLIVDFLDNKIGIIEGVLNDLNKQVEILEKYKKSLITEKVTKGLNSEIKMKDSGIDWIGMIPENWEIKPIKYISKVHSSIRIFEEEYVENGIPFFRTKEIAELANNKEISLELYITKERYNKLKGNHVKKGDILISSIGTIGEVWISDGRDFWYKDGNITQIDCGESFDSEYIKYFIKSNCFVESIKYWESTTTISALTIEKIKKICITFPSILEQQKIVEFLNKKCIQIDEIIKDKQIQIDKIEKHKKSLIYEYVTGKKRVKGAEELYV